MTCDFWIVDAAPEVVEKPGDTSLSKLKMLYAQAKELSENEVRYACSTSADFLLLLFYTTKIAFTKIFYKVCSRAGLFRASVNFCLG